MSEAKPEPVAQFKVCTGWSEIPAIIDLFNFFKKFLDVENVDGKFWVVEVAIITMATTAKLKL